MKDLRMDMFLTREELPRQMLRAGVPRDHVPCVKTIYNVEERGVIPRTRVMFGFARFYERPVRNIWGTS